MGGKKNTERTVNGACKFCGQIKMITLSEDEWLERFRKEDKEAEAIADEIATEECNCKEGSDWRADHYVMDQCRQNIENQFREDYEEIADLLQEAVPMIYHQQIKKISITTPEHGVATMTRSGGNMKIKFLQKHEIELTASY